MEGCGLCLYGKNHDKYADGQNVECMLEGYSKHSITDRCSKYKRDFKKNVVTKSIKRKDGGK